MIAPIEASYAGGYHDGESPLRHEVLVRVGAAELEMVMADGQRIAWRLDETRLVSAGRYGDPVLLERAGGRTGESLAVPSAQFLEELRQRDAARFGESLLESMYAGNWSLLLLAGLAVSLLVYFGYTRGVKELADVAARTAPKAFEERLGEAVLEFLVPPASRCGALAATKPVDDMFGRLTAAAGSNYRFRLVYSKNPIVNAFAAPGGVVVVFRGLLQKAGSPEELAGVLAHEIQHVTRRHGTRAVARHISGRAILSILSADSASSPVGFAGAMELGNLSYQRENEEEADLAGRALLLRAGLPADGLARFLRRLQAEPAAADSRFQILSSHPALLERAARLENEAARAPSAAGPIMSPEEWERARSACR